MATARFWSTRPCQVKKTWAWELHHGVALDGHVRPHQPIKLQQCNIRQILQHDRASEFWLNRWIKDLWEDIARNSIGPLKLRLEAGGKITSNWPTNYGTFLHLPSPIITGLWSSLISGPLGDGTMPLASKKLRKILKKLKKIPENSPKLPIRRLFTLGLAVIIWINVLVNAGMFLWQFEKSLQLYPSITCTPIMLAVLITVNQPHFTMRMLRA